MADTAAWFPAGLSQPEIDVYLAEYPDDPHRAAAAAWYDNAAAQDLVVEGAVQSVSTGAQSVTYAGGQTLHDAATARGDWHLGRAKVRSVLVGPMVGRLKYGEVAEEVEEMDMLGGTDEDGELIDAGTIETAFFPPVGG